MSTKAGQLQAKEGCETAVAFFISLVSAILGKPVLDRTVVLGEMSVQGMLLKVASLPERMQLAVEAGAKRILIPSENKRDLAEVPDAILTAIQWQFYDSPTKAAIMTMGDGVSASAFHTTSGFSVHYLEGATQTHSCFSPFQRAILVKSNHQSVRH